MSPRLLAGLAVAIALAASTYVFFADPYTEQRCTTNGIPTECTETSSTLIDENGPLVLAILAVPVVMAAAVAFLLGRGPTALALAVAVAFLFLCGISATSVGIVYLPSGVLALVAAVMESNRRSRRQPASEHPG